MKSFTSTCQYLSALLDFHESNLLCLFPKVTLEMRITIRLFQRLSLKYFLKTSLINLARKIALWHDLKQTFQFKNMTEWHHSLIHNKMFLTLLESPYTGNHLIEYCTRNLIFPNMTICVPNPRWIVKEEGRGKGVISTLNPLIKNISLTSFLIV